MSTKKTVLVTGAGGFIGHHLVTYLVANGCKVKGVDIKPPQYAASAAHEFVIADLRDEQNCLNATRGMDEVYHLAADMGGIGYITGFHADISTNNTLINVHMLRAARESGVGRFLFSSSACVYPQYLQKSADVAPLCEDDAWPADPEEGYGLEKLYMEKLCQYYMEDHGLETRGSLPLTYMARWALMTAVVRKRRLRYVARSRSPRTAAPLKSGVTANRHDRSCISTTALRESIASAPVWRGGFMRLRRAAAVPRLQHRHRARYVIWIRFSQELTLIKE